MAYLYRHIRLDKNEPFYIGIGSDANYKRSRNRVNRNLHWKRIISKAPYKIDIVLDDLSWEDACIKEKEFISLYGRRQTKKGSLCNLTDGGDGTLGQIVVIGKETRRKMSESHKGLVPSNKGVKHSDETKMKMSKSSKGKKKSEQHKKKMSNALIGNERWLGKKHKKESRIKISNSIKLWHAKRKLLKQTRNA